MTEISLLCLKEIMAGNDADRAVSELTALCKGLGFDEQTVSEYTLLASAAGDMPSAYTADELAEIHSRTGAECSCEDIRQRLADPCMCFACPQSSEYANANASDEKNLLAVLLSLTPRKAFFSPTAEDHEYTLSRLSSYEDVSSPGAPPRYIQLNRSIFMSVIHLAEAGKKAEIDVRQPLCYTMTPSKIMNDWVLFHMDLCTDEGTNMTVLRRIEYLHELAKQSTEKRPSLDKASASEERKSQKALFSSFLPQAKEKESRPAQDIPEAQPVAAEAPAGAPDETSPSPAPEPKPVTPKELEKEFSQPEEATETTRTPVVPRYTAEELKKSGFKTPSDEREVRMFAFILLKYHNAIAEGIMTEPGGIPALLFSVPEEGIRYVIQDTEPRLIRPASAFISAGKYNRIYTGNILALAYTCNSFGINLPDSNLVFIPGMKNRFPGYDIMPPSGMVSGWDGIKYRFTALSEARFFLGISRQRTAQAATMIGGDHSLVFEKLPPAAGTYYMTPRLNSHTDPAAWTMIVTELVARLEGANVFRRNHAKVCSISFTKQSLWFEVEDRFYRAFYTVVASTLHRVCRTVSDKKPVIRYVVLVTDNGGK